MALNPEHQAQLDALRAVGEAARDLLKRTVCARGQLEVSVVVSDPKYGTHVFTSTSTDLALLAEAARVAVASVEHVNRTGERSADVPLSSEPDAEL